jgi:cutinase
MGNFVGPPFQTAFQRKFGSGVKTIGVPYPADVSGALTGASSPKTAQGAIKMAEMARQALATGSYVVLSGYSQGAEQVHGALLLLGDDAAKIAVYSSPLLSLFPFLMSYLGSSHFR